MKSQLCALLALITGSAFLMGQSNSSSPATQAEVVKSNNAFAVDLYAHLRTKSGNLFFSPESISTAFAMTYAGAHGQTAAEMARVFHFTLPTDQLHPAMGALLASMNAKHEEYELHVADALWAQQNENFLPAYLKLVQADYGAGFHPVDFKSSAEAVRGTINQWVEQQTNNKIQNLIPPGAITPGTLLVLTDAIYFKGSWLYPFNLSSTQVNDFHLSATQTVRAPMMGRMGSYRYYDGGTFQALELLYKGNELSMVVLLPKKIDGLATLEKSLTAANLSVWIKKLAPWPKVNLVLPRFTITEQFELSNTLSAMGMPHAFNGSADFSGMTGKPDFLISAAIHKAFVDVNETGTEAAAATGVVMVGASMREANEIIAFVADHPFLFMIRDTRSGSILFLGRVADPTK